MLEGCLEETLRTTSLTQRAERIRSVFSLVGGRVSEGGTYTGRGNDVRERGKEEKGGLRGACWFNMCYISPVEGLESHGLAQSLIRVSNFASERKREKEYYESNLTPRDLAQGMF